ncbi:RloB family protein [Clostridium estertheticum]|uniref:RloB family protein n=1 Tax=Clostridium estertheticum TaxID=238834 RepID=UPI001C6E3B54|nr:RloB family protein [Clostridium estertheticum]MBW9154520.1 RloB family protein [Clostridium estertheticum]WLC86409.1 RloB family protein [Clostridium estertheticum]
MGVKRNIGELSRDKRRKRRVKPTILIISEGKDTEVNYFKEFNLKYVNVDIKIADKNSAGKNKSRKTDPSHLVDKAIDYIDHKYDITCDDGDSVWCLIDVDLNYKNPDTINQRVEEIEKAYKKANNYEKERKKVINLGISNPCFEIWYLLHYIYTTANLKNYNAVKNKLVKETPLKDYEKNKCINSLLHDKTAEAIKNSVKLKAHHESLGKTLMDFKKSSSMLNVKDIIESNPYTNVWELVEYIEQLNLMQP